MRRAFPILAYAANVLLTAIWLLGFAAAFLNPTTYWLNGAAAVGLPFVTLALIPFVLWHVVRRRWIVLCLHVLAVILVIDRHWSIDRLRRPDARRGDFTLMTFNTPRHPDTEQAMHEMETLVRGVEPDMIGLQESIVFASKRDPNRIQAHAKFRTVVDSLRYTSIPPREGPPDASWVRWVQPVLSIHPIETQEQVTFDRDVAGWPTLKVLRTVMEYDGRRFAHYNIHLFTHGPSKPWNGEGKWYRPARWLQFFSEARTAFRIRAWQAEQIRRAVDKEAMPVIVSGDFNGTADNWSYHIISKGFVDSFRVAGSGWGATYHVGLPLLRIDFALFGPEFEVVRARVPSEYETRSDHLPLVVRFRWKLTEETETGNATTG